MFSNIEINILMDKSKNYATIIISILYKKYIENFHNE